MLSGSMFSRRRNTVGPVGIEYRSGSTLRVAVHERGTSQEGTLLFSKFRCTDVSGSLFRLRSRVTLRLAVASWVALPAGLYPNYRQ